MFGVMPRGQVVLRIRFSSGRQAIMRPDRPSQRMPRDWQGPELRCVRHHEWDGHYWASWGRNVREVQQTDIISS